MKLHWPMSLFRGVCWSTRSIHDRPISTAGKFRKSSFQETTEKSRNGAARWRRNRHEKPGLSFPVLPSASRMRSNSIARRENTMQKTDIVESEYLRGGIPDFRGGVSARIHVRVVEGNRER